MIVAQSTTPISVFTWDLAVVEGQTNGKIGYLCASMMKGRLFVFPARDHVTHLG